MLVASLFASLTQAQLLRAEAATVLINEYPVFTLKATLDGLSPAVRAGRIVQTLSGARLAAPLSMRTTARGIWVEHLGVPVVRVTEQEAKLQGVPAQTLAIQWKNRVEYALGLPAVQAANNFALLGIGHPSVVRLIGFEATSARFETSVDGVVKAERVPGGVLLTPLEAGETEVAVITPTGRTRVVVKVQPSAAQIPTQIVAELVSSPGTPSAVEAAIKSAIRQQLKTVEQATIEILNVPRIAVPMGSDAVIPVKVRVRAKDAATFEGDLRVQVRNLALARTREQSLWYSNHPESVRVLGPLFKGVLNIGEPVRMLYHHVNETTEPISIQVVVYNPTSQVAQIQLVRGDGEPDADPVRTGLDAGDQFLRAWLRPGSEVVTIPPRSALPIAARRLPQKHTISGLCYLSLMPGGAESVVIRTESSRPNAIDPSWRANPERPWLGVAVPITHPLSDLAVSEHVYSNPFRDLEANYRVGGRHAFVRIGQVPIASGDPARSLQGNFGVLYTVNATMENPTNSVSRVEVTFEASAGYSGGLFVVDGEVEDLKVLQSKAERTLRTLRLAPGERRLMKILTMPLSGSSYPATLTIRPAGK